MLKSIVVLQKLAKTPDNKELVSSSNIKILIIDKRRDRILNTIYWIGITSFIIKLYQKSLYILRSGKPCGIAFFHKKNEFTKWKLLFYN